MKSLATKVFIGAASFGQKYGIANETVLSSSEVAQIVDDASRLNFAGFDTAQEYGDSEAWLGLSGLTNAKVLTKFAHNTDLANFDEVRTSVMRSMERLGLPKLGGISVHSYSDLLNGSNRGVENLQRLVEENLVEEWGVSVYETSELLCILAIARPSFVQAPVNLVDRAFLTREVQDALASAGTKLHARSVFLQGVLLVDKDNIPRPLKKASSFFVELEEIRKAIGCSRQALLLGFVLRSPEVSRLVVGVNSLVQLRELWAAIEEVSALPSAITQIREIKLGSQSWTDPRSWSS